MSFLNESVWEESALETLSELGWQPLTGTDIAPSYEKAGEHQNRREKLDSLEIPNLLKSAIRDLNKELALSQAQVNQVADAILQAQSQDPKAENRQAHKYMTEGYKGLTITRPDGSQYNPTIRIISRKPDENHWLAIRQVTLKALDKERRFDIVLYCNGLPVGIIELKRAGDPYADLRGAHNQISQYLKEFPLAFRFNVLSIVSDGVTARYGTPFTPYTHMSVWNVDEEGEFVAPFSDVVGSEADTMQYAQDLLLFGVANQERFLDLLNNYMLFTNAAHETGGLQTNKIIAKPHQYFAVSKAVQETLRAVSGNQQIGVVWHTQGSGKSLEMVFYNNIVMRHPQLENPTTIVVTDRTDLDDQLFNTFAATLDFLPEKPSEIDSIAQLRTELQGRKQGGIYFTKLQKFRKTKEEKDAGLSHQMLSDRSNIIIIVDEAHRSHYDNLDGYARHLRDALPKASFIAFTGTPIETLAGSTQAVFGKYIDVYDLTRAVKDGATVPVKYESRYIPLVLPEDEDIDAITEAAERLTEDLDESERQKTEQAVLKMNTMYGSPNRLKQLAADLVEHWEARRDAMIPLIGVPGKAMIVGATRQICADLYDQIIELRPDWAGDSIQTGKLQVLYRGAPSDNPDVARFARNDKQSKDLQNRIKDPNDELELVIVQSMLLTGFDAPALHTLYLDRPIKGALLMQTLARVNRTYKDKHEALLVGYAPIIENLRDALGTYARGDNADKPSDADMQIAAENALNLITEIEYLLKPVTGWNEKAFLPNASNSDKLKALGRVMNFLIQNRRPPQPDENQTASETGTKRRPTKKIEKSIYTKFNERSAQLTRLYNFVANTKDVEMVERLKAKKNYVQFFQEVRVTAAKHLAEERASQGLPVPDDVQRLLDSYTRGLVETGEVKDLYELAGIPNPDLNELNLDFAQKMAESSNKSLALEALRKALQRQIRNQVGNNLTRRAYYGEKLQELMNKYNNAQISFMEVMEAILRMKDDLIDESMRGEEHGLTEEEMIFYDVLERCDRTELEYSSELLAKIARGIVRAVRKSPRNWRSMYSHRAALRNAVERQLALYDYPPEGQEEARQRVMEQLEIIAAARSAETD